MARSSQTHIPMGQQAASLAATHAPMHTALTTLLGEPGLILGLIVSYFFIGNVNAIAEFCRIDLYPGEAFGAEKIPHITLPWDVILISVLTLVAAVLGALIPAWRASSLNPVECLRHE